MTSFHPSSIMVFQGVFSVGMPGNELLATIFPLYFFNFFEAFTVRDVTIGVYRMVSCTLHCHAKLVKKYGSAAVFVVECAGGMAF